LLRPAAVAAAEVGCSTASRSIEDDSFFIPQLLVLECRPTFPMVLAGGTRRHCR
jgi:hypothetical protein